MLGGIIAPPDIMFMGGKKGGSIPGTIGGIPAGIPGMEVVLDMEEGGIPLKGTGGIIVAINAAISGVSSGTAPPVVDVDASPAEV